MRRSLATRHGAAHRRAPSQTSRRAAASQRPSEAQGGGGRKRAAEAWPPLPSYSELRRRVAWADQEGRFYVIGSDSATGAGAGADSDADADPETNYVLIPVGETRRRGTPEAIAAGAQQLEFPARGDTLSLAPLDTVHAAAAAADRGGAFGRAAGGREVRVESVERLRQNGAVAVIEFAPAHDAGAGRGAAALAAMLGGGGGNRSRR